MVGVVGLEPRNVELRQIYVHSVCVIMVLPTCFVTVRHDRPPEMSEYEI